MTKNKDNYVVLARVTPFGRMEKILMKCIKMVTEKFPGTRINVDMYDIFRFKTNKGEPYTKGSFFFSHLKHAIV